MTTIKTTRMIAAMALIVACFNTTTSAQVVTSGFMDGDHTLALSGSGSSDKDFDSNVGSIELDLAWFLTDATAVSLRQGIGFADTRGSSDWNASTRLALGYFFDFRPCVPFVGASIGYLYGDNVNETFIAGPEVGLRHFINPTTFINILVEYAFLFEDADEADEQFDDGRYVYTLGLGVRL